MALRSRLRLELDGHVACDGTGVRLGRPLVSLVFAACLLASCGGTDDVHIEALRTDPAAGGGTGSGALPNPSASDAGANRDAGAAPDAGSDAPTEVCPPIGDAPATGARWATVRQSTKPKTLDGDLSDYDGCVSIVLDGTTAARIEGKPAASAKVFVEWEPAALWIAADITDPKLQGKDPVRPYMNDSLEVYVSSAGLRTGDYGPNDQQFVIDHKGLSLRYRRYPKNGTPELNPDALAIHTPSGWRVEMRIDAVAMLGAPLAKGDVRFLDLMLTDGVRQSSFLVWAMQPHAACSCKRCDCNRSPAYDTLLFAPITLE